MLLSIFLVPTTNVIIAIIAMLLLLVLSALMSGSEVAFFSINSKDKEFLKQEKRASCERILNLLDKPKQLLATILIANNFINVAIVLVSTYVVNGLFNSNEVSQTTAFLIQVVAVTFAILLFGEVIPKVYANKYKIAFASFMASVMSVLVRILNPFSKLLINSTSFIDKKIKKKSDSISVNELEHALDLTKESVDNPEEKKILEGIVKFGHTDVKQTMTPRVELLALDTSIDNSELLEAIVESRYSRIPIYEESLDKIEGILYSKDLLPYVDNFESVDWKTLLRKPKFVPENKKLDDLLAEFQEEKMHMAIVVDEYGGTSGLITLEDVLEEIVGDITDEFDDEDLVFSKLDDQNYVFEGKTPLIDMYRVLEIDGEEFEEEKGEADTIAGFCIEQAGKILLKNEKVIFKNYIFTIEASDKRRIKQVKITIQEPVSKDDDNE